MNGVTELRFTSSAVGPVDIEDLHVTIGVIDPIGESEVANDGDLEAPAGGVEVRSVRQGKGIVADGGDCVLRRVFRVRDGSFSRNSTTSIEMRSRQVISSGFESLIKILERGPVLRILIVDFAGHAGLMVRELLVPQRNEKSGQALPFRHRKRLDLGFDLLDAHVVSSDIGGGFARRVPDFGFSLRAGNVGLLTGDSGLSRGADRTPSQLEMLCYFRFPPGSGPEALVTEVRPSHF